MRKTPGVAGAAIHRGQNQPHGHGSQRGRMTQELGTVLNLDPGLGLDRAAFAHDPGDQFLPVLLQKISSPVQDRGTRLRQHGSPGLLRSSGGPCCGGNVLRPGEAGFSKHVSGCRLAQGQRTGGRCRPAAVKDAPAPASRLQKSGMQHIHDQVLPLAGGAAVCPAAPPVPSSSWQLLLPDHLLKWP